MSELYAVALRQVIVDGDDMYAFSGQSVQISGQGGNEGLAFSRLHLGDHAFVQNYSAQHLHRERAHLKYSPGRLAAYRERIGEDIVQSLAVCEPLPEHGGHPAQLVLAHLLILFLKVQDLFLDRHDLLERSVTGVSEQSFEKRHSITSCQFSFAAYTQKLYHIIHHRPEL